MTLDAATKLLDDFRVLPNRVERPRTFMEIAGYPHYENASSNILAFFMDPDESHGLGTLVLDALLAGANNDATAGEGVGGNVSIEREVTTSKGNRIDLLIESDDHAIIIENKIFAGVSNPFDDYSAYLDRVANGRAERKLLLTLYPTREGSKWGFANLTYEEFVGQIRLLLGRYVSTVDTRYLTIFLDFLNTLENLREGTRMNQEFVKLLAERGDDVQGFLTEVMGFRDELRKKVRGLGGLIELEGHRNVRQWFYRQKTALFDDLVHDIRISGDLLVAVDTTVAPHGWDIVIWARSGDRFELRDLLERLHIAVEEADRYVHANFAYDANLEQIRPVLQGVIDKIAMSSGREE